MNKSSSIYVLYRHDGYWYDVGSTEKYEKIDNEKIELVFILSRLISFLFAILLLYLKKMELRVIRAIERRQGFIFLR